MAVVLAAAAACLLAFQEPAETHPRWIDDLGDESPADRDAACARLRAAGRAAWPALEKAARDHPDPEARLRARDLLNASRLRRRLSYRILDEHPAAVETLQAGGTAEKIRLLRTLGRSFEETSDLLLDTLRDPDPEVALAAAEILHENRNSDWTGRLLELFALEDCPRAGRIFELLCSASARIAPEDFKRFFAETGPRGRNRFLHLALHANLPLAVPPEEIRQMLRHGELATRRAALAWMRDRGPQGNLFEVEPLLSSPEPSLVAEALATLRALRHRPDPDGVDSLLRHDEASVREEAIQTVVAFEERGCFPALRRLLQDPSTAVRQSALAAIWRLQGAAALDDLLEVYLRDAGDSREQAASVLCGQRDWILPKMKRLAEDADPDRRQRAYDILGKIEGLPALFPLARDPDESVRRWALGQLLRKTEAPATIETVEVFARDSSESIRFEALRALVRLGRRDHVPDLQPFLSSAEYSLRYDAAETMLEYGGDRAEPLARSLIDDPDGPLRRLALGALEAKGDRRCVEQALAQLGDPDGRLKRAAQSYLNKLLQTGRDPALVARLAGTLETSDGESLTLAFRLVVDYGDRAVAPTVRRLLATGRAPAPERAVRALAEWAGDRGPAELVPLLGSDASLNELVFARARECRQRLPGAGQRELEETLHKLLGSPDRRVRRSAVGACEDLGFAAETLPILVNDPEASVRHAAISGCLKLGLAAAAPSIAGRLDDEDPDVRVAAVASLIKLRPFSLRDVEQAAAAEDCLWARRRMELALKR